MNKTLKELRELNSGANPERITRVDVQDLEDDILRDIEGHFYVKTPDKSEVEYILNNKGHYGVILNKVFYRQL